MCIKLNLLYSFTAIWFLDCKWWRKKLGPMKILKFRGNNFFIIQNCNRCDFYVQFDIVMLQNSFQLFI